MTALQILILGLIQGAAELLPISSSAHVIVAEKLMHLDPTSPEMTFLLVMLHTGTMFAVLLYFWRRWKITLPMVKLWIIATLATGVVGFGLKTLIEKVFLAHHEKAEIEHLFGNLPLIAVSLASAGLVILFAARKDHNVSQTTEMTTRQSVWIGIIQGLCLPFRGFSRSGATISTGMILGVPRMAAEDFSFALAVILTPAVIVREAHRLSKISTFRPISYTPGLFGMACSFIAGMIALRLLSSWLERGRWKYFGMYNLVTASAILAIHFLIL